MDCERSSSLISARLDGEVEPEDRALLEAHLAGCPACRATAAAFDRLDTDLRRALDPCTRSFAKVAERAIGRVRAEPAPIFMDRPQWARLPPRLAWGLAAAACLAGFILWHALPRYPRQPTEIAQERAISTPALNPGSDPDFSSLQRQSPAPEVKALALGVVGNLVFN